MGVVSSCDQRALQGRSQLSIKQRWWCPERDSPKNTTWA